MGTFLDNMKDRLEAAKTRLAAAQQAHQAATVELQSAGAEYNIWNNAVVLELREEEKRQAAAHEKQIPMPLPVVPANAQENAASEDTSQAAAQTDGVSKTERVRMMLREHASGVTPSGLWTELKDHFSSRAYLYSILKRLRDNDEVFTRRGKYLLKPKPVEVGTQEGAQIVQ